MHFGDQWTGGVEHLQSALLGLFLHHPGDTVGTENNDGVVGHLVQFLDENRAPAAQSIHHEAVVHHLMTHINRRPEHVQGTVDDGDGAIDAGTETTGIGETDIHRDQFIVNSEQ